MIEKKELGNTGILISEIGFGTWGISGEWGKTLSEKQILEVLNTATKNGINFFDTAAVYGNGRMEKMIGKISNQNIIISTKIPAVIKPKEPLKKFSYYYPKKIINQTALTSMKRLNKSSIDILLLHNWNSVWNYNAKKNLENITLLKTKKIAKAIGISLPNWMNHDIDELLENGFIDCVELPVNIFQQWGIKKVIKKAKKNNIGILARSCLDNGSLGGLMNNLDLLPESDFRKKQFEEPQKSMMIKKINKLLKKAKITQKQLPSYAIQFVISHKGITSAIIGMRDKQTVIKNILDYKEKFTKMQLSIARNFEANK
ncbi:MAG: aldo/keto reductase [archaeon]|nr:aldo/keto reductase [archaeon]